MEQFFAPRRGAFAAHKSGSCLDFRPLAILLATLILAGCASEHAPDPNQTATKRRVVSTAIEA